METNIKINSGSSMTRSPTRKKTAVPDESPHFVLGLILQGNLNIIAEVHDLPFLDLAEFIGDKKQKTVNLSVPCKIKMTPTAGYIIEPWAEWGSCHIVPIVKDKVISMIPVAGQLLDDYHTYRKQVLLIRHKQDVIKDITERAKSKAATAEQYQELFSKGFQEAADVLDEAEVKAAMKKKLN